MAAQFEAPVWYLADAKTSKRTEINCEASGQVKTMANTITISYFHHFRMCVKCQSCIFLFHTQRECDSLGCIVVMTTLKSELQSSRVRRDCGCGGVSIGHGHSYWSWNNKQWGQVCLHHSLSKGVGLWPRAEAPDFVWAMCPPVPHQMSSRTNQNAPKKFILKDFKWEVF